MASTATVMWLPSRVSSLPAGEQVRETEGEVRGHS